MTIPAHLKDGTVEYFAEDGSGKGLLRKFLTSHGEYAGAEGFSHITHEWSIPMNLVFDQHDFNLHPIEQAEAMQLLESYGGTPDEWDALV